MKNQKGQALVEYILIVALMSILVISLIKFFSGYLKDAITKSSCNVAGMVYIKGDKAGQGTCEDKSIEDILNDTEDVEEKELEEDE